MPAGYSFRPRAWVLVLAALGCAAGVALGNWQSGRAEAKRAAAASVAQVALAGEFVARHTVLLDNKLRNRQPGYEVVTPLRLANSDEHVLVNRGWIAAPRTRQQLPEVKTPAGRVRIGGVPLERLPRVLAPAPQQGKVRQTLDITAYAAEIGLRLQPRVIEQHSDLDDGLLREWPRPDAGVEKHQSYALQWYALALLAVILGVVFSFRKA
jgi:surfeit locus 1 family protein